MKGSSVIIAILAIVVIALCVLLAGSFMVIQNDDGGSGLVRAIQKKIGRAHV